ncbi:hypothetical protein [Streptosporangium saharense]|uniref:hypothetical protein n=1 Tax=Streptosporangium saharense TaxID=1706840 RepID=UPI0034327B4C
MSKRSTVLWAAAILTAAAPSAWFWIVATLSNESGGSYSSLIVAMGGICPGFELDLRLQILLTPLRDFPLMEYGAAPLIALSWGGVLLARRIGRPRLGRILPYLTVALLVVSNLPSPLLFVLDMARDPACAGNWGPPEITTWNNVMGLYALVPAVLVLLAPRTPGARRGRLARVGVSLVLAAPVLLCVTASSPAGKVSAPRDLECLGFDDGAPSRLTKQDRRFLCAIRDGLTDETVPELAKMPDRELLAYGDRLCELAVRNGGNLRAPELERAMGRIQDTSALTGALTGRCPVVAQAIEEEDQRMKAENDAYVATAKRRCAAQPRHRPRIKPVRRASATMWTEFWYINAWDEGNEGESTGKMVADLVGSSPGALDVWAADEIGHACVTGESYRRRPPVETRG